MLEECHKLADDVWIFPCSNRPNTVQPNIGIILTNSGTVLIDAGNSPLHASAVLSTLSDLDAPPITHLIYTHHHWDHVFGAQSYKAENIIAHDQCANYLHQYASRTWNNASLREEVYRDPRFATRNTNIANSITDWRGFRVIEPTVTFTKKLVFYLDGLTLELQHVGGRHADDSIVVKVVEKGVMFIGDCYYPPVVHEREHQDDVQVDTTMITELVSDQYQTYVDGHSGTPLTLTRLKQLAANVPETG